MNSQKKTGRLVGLLLLLMLVAGAPSVSLRGISSTLAVEPGFLMDVFDKALQMRYAILLDMVATGIGIAVAITAFPILTKYSKRIAICYVGFWMIQLGVVALANISHLTLISLSEEYIKAGSPEVDYYRTLSFVLTKGYVWAHLVSLILFSSGGMLFYSLLYQTKLIPRVIAGWGLIALALVFGATWAQIFGNSVSFNFYAQNGIHVIVLTGWLLTKGFKSEADSHAHEINGT